MTGWTAADIPDLEGRRAVVTGANSGIGEATARELARHRAHVVLAVRDTAKGEDAVRRIRSSVADAVVEVRELDLASLASVRRFAASQHQPLDLLVNNAGVMQTPRGVTADGFERQLGTNHLGHFALTGLLLDVLAQRRDARVVTVSSIEHKAGHIRVDDLQFTRGYTPRKAYQQSKLANAVFGIELDRRLRAAHSPVTSVLAHPGVAVTRLATSGPAGASAIALWVATRVIGQSAAAGALPILYAATARDVEGGRFYGPSGGGEMRGAPVIVEAIPEAYDEVIGAWLWEESERLTGVPYPTSV